MTTSVEPINNDTPAGIHPPPAMPAWVDRAAYPFTSRVLDLGGGRRVHYVDHGQGPTLLFVHGTPTWSFEYRHLLAALAPGYRCVAPDHLGFGLSSRPHDFAYTPEAHADVLRALVERLDLRDVTLVVHDFGGPIGLPLAVDAASSRITRLVLLNTWCWPLDDEPRMTRAAKLIQGPVGKWLYKYANASVRLITPAAYGDRRKLTPAIHAQYLEVFRDREARVRVLHSLARALLGSRSFYASTWARRDRLQALPTLIVWGMKDSAFPPSFLDTWRGALPQAQVVSLAGAGHWPHEEEPAAVSAAVHAFLARFHTGAS